MGPGVNSESQSSVFRGTTCPHPPDPRQVAYATLESFRPALSNLSLSIHLQMAELLDVLPRRVLVDVSSLPHRERAPLAWWMKVRNPRLWGGPRPAAEATASVQAAQAALRGA